MSYGENRKVYHDYEILEKYEAGIILKGHEVKAIRNGKISILGSYVQIIDNEAFLIGATIVPYQPKNTPQNYDPEKNRKLLLNKKEITGLIGKVKERGLTIVPLKVYDKKGKIKIEIGLAKAKKKYDKRRSIRKREEKRKIERVLKQY
ncbi:MAG: SsrA-binding protein [Parcubacteria group bacterium RIFCSPLOWO2_01_FULL_40_65]|nr:MAG: SsrA-binding protein [Parcubacteria group bacterium RIFCSPHIGHO2_01_FULL_40_30]OHB19438.1 MAG: SsrA-binding protein [Parcubacteria group bacterium RIFCSPHIGHO2_02_FULL_40_12]OHB21613.1 MAG: SsrA-binding protein [Parcubacteria group bacterium RIFCSPLOWO2_01_FULL_40_65]OHB23466.1 MAG: SsrA-binding protein [Parcubacteria group bacterium RIFCSPLOWO2_02_FULL_40_12]OHB23931.1 MAG: SsrA-binding protein [Parcubacteria group bacterium RIFCSPLOWO2_12_FULL_40_10]